MIILFNYKLMNVKNTDKKTDSSVNSSSKLNYFIKRKLIKDVPELKLLNNQEVFNDLLNITKNEKRTIPKDTQTDFMDYNTMEKKLISMEEERDKLKVDKLSLNNEIEKYLNQVIELKQEIVDIKKNICTKNEDLKKKDITIENLTNTSLEYRSNIESLNKEIVKLKINNDELLKKYERLENEFKVYKKQFGEKENKKKHSINSNTKLNGENEKIYNSQNKEGFIIRFFKQKLINRVVKYLNIEDIANLKLVNSVFCDSIERDNELSSVFLNKIIRRKNDKIVMLMSDKHISSIQEDYNVNNPYVEELIQK